MSNWIRCSERMPEVGQQVLATNQKLHIYETAIFFYADVSGVEYFGTSSGRFIATHWHPLPEPPKEGE